MHALESFAHLTQRCGTWSHIGTWLTFGQPQALRLGATKRKGRTIRAQGIGHASQPPGNKAWRISGPAVICSMGGRFTFSVRLPATFWRITTP